MESPIVKNSKMKKRPRGGASHLCPKCGSPSHVLVTRRQKEEVFRDRECLAPRCGHQFRTREIKLGAA